MVTVIYCNWSPMLSCPLPLLFAKVILTGTLFFIGHRAASRHYGSADKAGLAIATARCLHAVAHTGALNMHIVVLQYELDASWP